MVAYDELGSLVPIKRTLQVIDYQNQANKELEVRCKNTQQWWELCENSTLLKCYLLPGLSVNV